jgi:hypothetical protein
MNTANNKSALLNNSFTYNNQFIICKFNLVTNKKEIYK